MLKPILLFITVPIALFLIFRYLKKSFVWYNVKKYWRVLEDKCLVYQFYRVPQFNDHMQENQLYRKVSVYLNSLPSVENSDFTSLFSGNKSSEISLVFDSNQSIVENFLSAIVHWSMDKSPEYGKRTFVLKIRRSDKRRILRPYLQHIHTVFDEIEQRGREVKLYFNAENDPARDGRWTSVPFSHPATIDTVLMDSDQKNKVKADLELFLKSKQYYHRLGRVWRRSYLLYGPSGTGKSSFVAAMAKFISYDIYDVDLSKLSGDSDLKMLMLQTTNKSMIVIEDLDRYLISKSTALSLSGILNFMDGILSCCGEERVMVITMNGKDQIDPTVLRPGRIDVHIQFPLCDFNAFKALANSHLGLKDHKLFPRVEEIFETGAGLSPAEISEIMISNRTSPTRAIKSVITALQTNCANKLPRRLSQSSSGRAVEESGPESAILSKESVHTVREFRKLYGLLRMRSSRKESMDLDSADNKDNSKHEA